MHRDPVQTEDVEAGACAVGAYVAGVDQKVVGTVVAYVHNCLSLEVEQKA